MVMSIGLAIIVSFAVFLSIVLFNTNAEEPLHNAPTIEEKQSQLQKEAELLRLDTQAKGLEWQMLEIQKKKEAITTLYATQTPTPSPVF